MRTVVFMAATPGFPRWPLLAMLAAVFLTVLASVGLVLPVLAREAAAPDNLGRVNRALLIGVTEYPALDQRLWLNGPANDVDLVRRFLLSHTGVPFSPENIKVLADLPTADGIPTAANIRAAFAQMAEQVAPGDFVYIQFSGHGSQLPALDPATETDGLDEVFLPRDVGTWDGHASLTGQVLRDDEIGRLLDGLRARGATVWAVFDTCHSGTVTRAALPPGDEMKLRRVTPADLGIPQSVMDFAARQAQGRLRSVRGGGVPEGAADLAPAPDHTDAGGNQRAGSLVAFFAAQSSQRTPERRLPRGAADRRMTGVFTFTLLEALAANPGITYRQLAQDVLRRYSVRRLSKATPLFEGPLDLPVFSASHDAAPTAGPRQLQWPAQIARDGTITLDAGRLHGLVPSSRLLILTSPADPDDRALGVVEITSADTFSAQAVIAAGPDGKVPEKPPRGAWLRLAGGGRVDMALHVALAAQSETAAQILSDALRHARDAGMLPATIGFVHPDQPSDLTLTALDADLQSGPVLEIAPSDGLAATQGDVLVPRIATSDKSPEQLGKDLAHTLTRMSAVHGLLALGNAMPASSLLIDATLLFRAGAHGPMTPLPDPPVPTLHPGNQLGIDLRNREKGPVDINILYVQGDWAIKPVLARRLQSGDRLRTPLIGISEGAFGRDRLLVVATRAGRNSATEDLSFLAQDSLSALRSADPAPTQLGAFLAEALLSGPTRSGAEKAAKPRGAMLLFELDTAPAR